MNTNTDWPNSGQNPVPGPPGTPRNRPPLRCALVGALLLALTALLPGASAAAPIISSFAAVPANIKPGEAASLAWSVAGATSLSIDQGVGWVGGGGISVSPSMTTVYTLTAANPEGSVRAATTVTVSPLNYLMAYDSQLEGTWQRETWESSPLFTDFAAAAPGRTGRAIEVRFGTGNAYNAFGIGDVDEYLNEFRTFEFDIYFEPDSTGHEDMTFILGDAGFADEPRIVDLIPGWAGLPASQRFGHWLHATVGLQDLHPNVVSANRFLWFNNGSGSPHFRLADVKLGWTTDTVAPSVTRVTPSFDGTTDQLTLAFTTDEPTIYWVEYGVSNYLHSAPASYYGWSTNHTAVLTDVVPGALNQYRIVLLDHHTDPAAEANVGVFEGAYMVPASTNAPRPVIVDSAPDRYVEVYDSALTNGWSVANWETGSIPTDLAGTAPGRAGSAIELRFGTNNNWNAFGLAAGECFFNEFRTLEFDVYFEPDSSGNEELSVVVADAGLVDSPRLVDLIPGWFTFTHEQRSGHWFHLVVDFAQLHPKVASFNRFLFMNGGVLQPHFRLAGIRLGWSQDTTPPVVTLDSTTLSPKYDQLTLRFQTDESSVYRVDFGVNDYGRSVQGDASGWSGSHSAVLDGLTPGTTIRYRIVAVDHRNDPAAAPNQGVLEGTYQIPPAPVVPPLISGLGVDAVAGTRATLVWTNDRPCTAQLVYQKAGGEALTRDYPELSSNHAAVMDLLEPLTSYAATVTVTDAFGLVSTQSITFTTGAASAPTVTISIDPAQAKAISPWIYGVNFYNQISGAPGNLTLDRTGGNRWTAYNWENNASNAGNDWYYSSDDYLGGGTTPAEAVRGIIEADRARGAASLMTVQMQGYAAADKNGSVDLNDPNHIANRFRQVAYQKGSAFTATPAANDSSVYMDEFLWALRGKFPGDIYADPATPTFVSLDNEPDLWFATHKEIQPVQMAPAEFFQRTIALSQSLKALDPSVVLFGPVNYGLYGMTTFQGAAGYDLNHWFVDGYLEALSAASATAGKRLLDVYDFHWYSEARAGNSGILSLRGSNLTPDQIQAIVQSPRSLWDPSYTESSWIVDYLGGPIAILPRMQAKIDSIWPGTKLAITEYDNGGDNHIAGAIAQADNLGIFGAQGLFAASYWPMSGQFPFILAAFRMYRDYDGANATFGDISLAATSSATTNVAAYVSQDSQNPNRFVIVAINRSFDSQDVGFNGLSFSGKARVFRLEGASTTPVLVGQVPAQLPSWVITLPPLSISTIELTADSQNTTTTTPSVTAWPTATAIGYGQTLGTSALNRGSASTAGAFTWTDGSQTPATGAFGGSVTFTPSDPTRFNSVTGIVSVTVAPKALTPSITLNNRAYDGTTTATTIATASLGGVISGDAVTLGASGTVAAFPSKNVGSYSGLVVGNLTLAGASAANYVLSETSVTASARITARVATPSVTLKDKVYDRTTSAVPIVTRSLTGVVAGEVVSLGTSGTVGAFPSRNVGAYSGLVVSSLALSGADAANYILATNRVTASASITAKAVTPSVTLKNRVYDGTTTAPSIASRTLAGVVAGDSVTLGTSGTVGVFPGKAVGAYSGLSVTGLALSGTAASNYALTTTTATAGASITPKSVTPSVTLSNRVYDGSTSATTIAKRSLSGVVTGDAVTLGTSGLVSAFPSAAVGAYSGLLVTGFGLSGADASNYTLGTDHASASARITAKPLVIQANSFVKPRGQTLSFTGTEFTTNGLVSGDGASVTSVTLSSAGAKASAAVGKYNVTASAAVGVGLTNYTLSYVAGTLTVIAVK